MNDMRRSLGDWQTRYLVQFVSAGRIPRDNATVNSDRVFKVMIAFLIRCVDFGPRWKDEHQGMHGVGLQVCREVRC